MARFRPGDGLYGSDPCGRKTGYQSADIEQVIAGTVLTDPLTSSSAATVAGNHEENVYESNKG
jgi:hypothetical protein